MSVITIVGAGMMGSAMAIPAADNGHSVRLVGTPLDREIISRLKEDGYHLTLKRNMPEGVLFFYAEEMGELLDDTDLLIGGVSSFGVDWFADNVAAVIPEELPVLSVTKGLAADGERLISFPDYIRRRTGRQTLSLNAVGGPCISFELADRHHTAVAFCGDSMETLEKIKKMLETEYYHIKPTTDVIGVETAVAMKNAYALGVSLAIGMAERKNGEGCPEEYNPEAGLFYQSVKEMLKLIRLNGGDGDIAALGAGDLYVTVFGGRTRRIGTLLGRGLTYAQAREVLDGVTLESVAISAVVSDVLRELEKKGAASTEDFPLLMHIDSIIRGGAEVQIPWKAFVD